MSVYIQQLHSAREVTARNKFPAIFHDGAIHPVIFRTGGGDEFKSFSVVAARHRGPQRARVTGPGDHDAIVVSGGYQGRLPETRMPLDANLVSLQVGVSSEAVNQSADAPAPGYQRTRIIRLAPVPFVDQTDDVTGQIGATAVGLHSCRVVITNSDSVGRRVLESGHPFSVGDNHRVLSARSCGVAALGGDYRRVSELGVAGFINCSSEGFLSVCITHAAHDLSSGRFGADRPGDGNRGVNWFAVKFLLHQPEYLRATLEPPIRSAQNC